MSIELPRERRIVHAGKFEAWLVATDSPKDNFYPGPSAHAWEIRQFENETVEDRDVAASGPKGSDESNGYTTGAYRLIEATPDRSSLHIWTRSNYVVQAFKGRLDDWCGNGFLGADGKPLAHRDYWMKIDEERKRRSINVSADLLRNSNWNHEQIYKRLMRDAKLACAKLSPRRPGR